ncbi:tRNA-splicing endonuclease subunit sen34 [Diaporthe helianthi]|uniref:tRNA-splicing endonuclease subunit Sen34 n=1 Tax=Diaporthe helianthi TaxID=158607 RepID=A0A2P5HPK5_DIAHE|nr:tRNA-splicing endonuclease subunit sen34 [Diaporthe helianthi]
MAELIRITKVGGRYLVFEVKDVASLRRDHYICAVLVGTTPQNPTQNLFSGLPLELLPEEAKLLEDKGVAHVVDEAASHLAHLTSTDPTDKHAYLQSLRTRRQNFSRVLDEEDAIRKAEGAKMRRKQKPKRNLARADSPPVIEEAELPVSPPPEKSDEASVLPTPTASHDDSLFSSSPKQRSDKTTSSPTIVATNRHLTETTSLGMLSNPKAYSVPAEAPRSYPLYRHLNSKGYYITPGIRFGADYSVYPGDPFRYHAHFMATSFGWDEEITLLDLVSGGRLGTGVKKGFLIGGQAPPEEAAEDAQNAREDRVRTFTLEWAAM